MEQDHAGYETFISAQGTLKVAGRTFPIKNGLGVHERAILGQSWDIIPELMGGNEFYWMLCMNNDFQMFMFRHTGKGIDYGQLRVEGQDISYMPARGLGSVSFTTLERWHDPGTGLYIPCKWHLTMASAQGIVDLDVVGQGRAYYHYNAKKGVLIMM